MSLVEKYVLTMTQVKGSIVYGFRGSVLVLFHNEAEMDEAGLMWMYDKIPASPDQLRAVAAFMNSKGRTCKLEVIPPDLSFDAFWNQYGKKINRKRCEPEWKKMTDPDKIKCLLSIRPYEQFLLRNPGRGKMDPENYLKRGGWDNDWGRV